MATKKPAVAENLNTDAPFDLESWLTGAKPATASLRVTTKLGLVEQINLLAEEIEAGKDAPESERTVADAAPADPSEEYKALVAEYLDSFQEFTFRGRLPGDWQEIAAAMKAAGTDRKDLEAANIFATAHFSVSPKLTVEQVERLIPAIGAPQWERIVKCWSDVVNGVVEPSAPLSRGLSRGR